MLQTATEVRSFDGLANFYLNLILVSEGRIDGLYEEGVPFPVDGDGTEIV